MDAVRAGEEAVDAAAGVLESMARAEALTLPADLASNPVFERHWADLEARALQSDVGAGAGAGAGAGLPTDQNEKQETIEPTVRWHNIFCECTGGTGKL